MAEPARGRLRHQSSGRTRIALEQPLPRRHSLERLAEELAGLPGVQSIEIRPTTGSLIVRHEGEFEPIGGAAAERELLELLPNGPEPSPDVIQATVARLAMIDGTVSRVSGGRADLWSLVFAGLMAGGLVQLARGRVAGPALTLFGQAATMAMARPFRAPKR